MLLPANPSGRQPPSCGSGSAKVDLVSESAGAQQCPGVHQSQVDNWSLQLTETKAAGASEQGS